MEEESAAGLAPSRPSPYTANTERPHPATTSDHTANTYTDPQLLPLLTLSLLHNDFLPPFDKPLSFLVHSSLASDETPPRSPRQALPNAEGGSSSSLTRPRLIREPQAHSAPSLTFTVPRRNGPRPPALLRSPLPSRAAPHRNDRTPYAATFYGYEADDRRRRTESARQRRVSTADAPT